MNRKHLFKIAPLCLAAGMLLSSCASDGGTAETENNRLVNPNAASENHITASDVSTENTEPSSDTSAPDTNEEPPKTAEVPVPEDYIDRMVFLGNSTTYGLRYYEVLKGGKDTTQVWTPASGTLSMYNLTEATIVYPEAQNAAEKNLTIREALIRKQPEYFVITLGVNGIAAIKEDAFKTAYKSVIEITKEASPNTKIICQSMYPVAKNYDKLGSINNQKISMGNEWIKAVAEETGVHYVDSYSVLIGEDGWLPQEYTNGDGLHLSPEGFAVVIENLEANPYPG